MLPPGGDGPPARPFSTHLSVFSRNYLIKNVMFLLVIFKLGDLKPAAVDKNDFKVKKRKGKVSKTKVLQFPLRPLGGALPAC